MALFSYRTLGLSGLILGGAAVFALPVTQVAAIPVDTRVATFSSTAKRTNYGDANLLQITEGLFLRRIDAYYIFFSDTRQDPLDLASGLCFGGAFIKNTQVHGGGVCSLKDDEGNSFALSFTPSQVKNGGMTSGTWKVLGGAGPWLKAQGGGTFIQTPLANQDLSITSIKGNIDF
ncbi:hypothetical protein [Flexibacterium corallicola]|uniref:hypothetical protein n=1 Tax=Flexibacterium corallicola TaxID=3037259 RepID=UPI00286F0CA4|nr:hypothetical protein [Pseudovibrio sp. M1P-2-3]